MTLPSLRPLALVLLILSCGTMLGFGAPAEGKKGKGKGGAPTGSFDTVAAAKPVEKNSTFKLTSPAVKDGEKLPVEFTGDGTSASPPLAWTGMPKGTQSLVLIMHHLDPEGKTKIYWLIHDINPQTTSVAKNATDFGKMGISTVHHRVEYASPHSKGPGEKKYVLTLFALSAKPDLSQAESPITVDPLLAAMKGKILAAADLTVLYTRPAGASDSKEEKRPPRREEGAK
ncbi:putative lipoprotein LppC [Opitutia bacterium]|nr:putative lipoprotein LppC [Opitutae bacterium]